VDLTAAFKHSRTFYREHQLADWAEALPSALPDLAAEDLQQAAKAGFTRAFAFPPFSLQMASLDRLIEEMARKPAPNLPDNQQYREPFLADTWSKTPNGKVLQRADNLEPRTDGPYLLLASPEPCKTAWGRTGKQIVELFQTKSWQGLTVPEYLVLQRYYCELFRDHRFFDTPQDETPAHWLWLVDSLIENEMTVVYGSPRGLNLQACKISNRDSRRAALATQVLALV
jgi:hypothetical protein